MNPEMVTHKSCCPYPGQFCNFNPDELVSTPALSAPLPNWRCCYESKGVEKYRCSVHVRDAIPGQPDQGTEFHIRLPRKPSLMSRRKN
jgi:hypothetical protein